MDITQLRAANAARWAAMRLTTRLSESDTVAARLCAPAAKARYQAIEKRTGVPWWVVAVIHEREASQSWSANIAQGDPWDRRSTHVPAGRGPFHSFEDAAADALLMCPPFAGRNRDWTPGGALTELEQYNGLGYASRNVPSPYLWASTDQYVSGKYVADHVYDANHVDTQIGCAALLKRMARLDGSVMGVAAPTQTGPKVPPAAPAAQPLWRLVLDFISKLITGGK